MFCDGYFQRKFVVSTLNDCRQMTADLNFVVNVCHGHHGMFFKSKKSRSLYSTDQFLAVDSFNAE